MIPARYRGSPPSKAPEEILALLQTGDLSIDEIVGALPSRRKIRSVRYHLGLLHKAGKIEVFAKIGDLRKPRYRLVRDGSAKPA